MSIFIGSVIATFVAQDGSASDASAAVNSLLTDTTAFSDIQVRSVYFNGRSYLVAKTQQLSPSDSYNQKDNTGLIIGLVVGLVGGAILIVGSVFGYQKCQKIQKGQRLMDDPEENSAMTREAGGNNTNPSASNNDGTNTVRRASVTPPDTSNFNNNRLYSPLSNNVNGNRPPSGAVSITMLDHLSPSNQPSSTMTDVDVNKAHQLNPRSQLFSAKSVSGIELIKFD
jgi:hypothetical protein